MMNTPAQAGNEKAANQDASVLKAIDALKSNKIQDAFELLETAFSKRFYADMSVIHRTQLNPAIKQAFDQSLNQWTREVFADRLTQAGLPVIASGISDQELLRILGNVNSRYEWRLSMKGKLENLGLRLTKERVEELRTMARHPKSLQIWTATDALTWSPSELRDSLIADEETEVKAGVRIVFNDKSDVSTDESQLLKFHNVDLFPYASGCMINISDNRKLSVRQLVVVDKNDQIVEGLKKRY